MNELHAFLTETKRISAKVAHVLDGEPPRETFYALLALASHCAREAGIANVVASAIFADALEKRP